VASLGSVQAGTGSGGRQRKAPAVEAAYGTPWKSRYSPVTVPRTGPASVCAISVAASISTPGLGSTSWVGLSWRPEPRAG
jgi:hypothetical protein